jgi:hypothetical protein
MARGGYGGGGLPLHARHRTGPASAPPDPTTVALPAGAPDCPARHCWVRVPADGGAPRAGLLLEWRQDGAGGWSGRVVYAAELRAGRWATVEEWLPAELLGAG